MRYIDPEFIIRSRIGDIPFPSWNTAILVFHSATRSRPIIDFFDCRPLEYKLLSGLLAEEVYTVASTPSSIGILTNIGSHFGGGPLAAVLVEELTTMGVKTVIGLGCAGSIAPKVKRGQQFIIDRALVTDGTSKAYVPQGALQCEPDADLLDLASSIAQDRGSAISRVTGLTVDAIYRETKENVSTWRSMGGEVMNMEVTPFYASAKACGMRAIYIGHVSDELFGDSWQSWYGEERNQMAQESADIAYKLARRISAH